MVPGQRQRHYRLSTWAYPNYAYYYGYYGAPYVGAAPYVGPYGGAYAQGRDADLKAARKLTDHAKPKTVAKNKSTPAPIAHKLANGSPARG
jgi:hypothetical protein